MAALRLIVGLGNPGERYARTRHNVGWLLLDSLAGEDQGWRKFQDLGLYCHCEGLLLAKPLTYMNESGRFIASFAHFHKIAPAEILACFDDLALPLGQLRLRPSGSSGGHNGMQSLIDAVGTKELARLRLGIGPRPAEIPGVDFVLSRFAAAEQKPLAQALSQASQAVRLAAKDGIAAAMNKFNAAPAEP